MEVAQYDVILVTLDPTIGSEMKKTRPCVIISPQEMNRVLNTLIIAPITNTRGTIPTRIHMQSGKVNGWIVLDQVRTIDRKRVIKKIHVLSDKEISKIKQVLKEMLVE